MPTLELEPVMDRVKHAVRDARMPNLDIDLDGVADDIRQEMTRGQKAIGRTARAVGDDIRRIDPQDLPLPAVIRDQLPGQKRRWPGRLLLVAGLAGLAAGLIPDVRRRVQAAATTAYAWVNERLTGAQRVDAVAFPAADAIQVNGDPYAQGELSPLPDGLGSTREEQLAPGADSTDYVGAAR